MVTRAAQLVLLSFAFATAACSSPDTTRGAVADGPLAMHAEYPAWVLDAAYDWDPLERPLALYLRANAPRGGSVDAAEDAAFDAALAALGEDLAAIMIAVGRDAARGDLALEQALTSPGFVDDVLTAALDRGVESASEPRIVAKWFDMDNVIVRVRYDLERGLLPAYFARFDQALRGSGRRTSSDLHAGLRQDVAREVARLNHAR